MKILTAEINLREQTRELEQAKPQLESEKHASDARSLNSIQRALTDRTDDVIGLIIELPNGESDFAKEIVQLNHAADAMGDAETLLAKLETGVPAIAAETEAIEWLLQAKRAGKGGGGGGGSNPGGGSRSGADLTESALALLGDSKEKEAKVVDREINQATGKSGRELPDEFRVGLDRYFEALENAK